MNIDLTKTLLIQTMSKDAKPMIEAIGKGQELTPTPQQRYVRRCLLSAGELVEGHRKMEVALALLSGYRPKRTPAGEMITRGDYVIFQVEGIHIRLVMLLDRALHLVNEVYRLGLPPRECRLGLVSSIESVKDSSIVKALKIIDKTVEPYRKTRNDIVHKGSLSDDRLKDIEAFYLLQRLEDGNQDPVVVTYGPIFKNDMDRYIEAKRSEFKPVIDRIADEINQLLDALHPVYTAFRDGLSLVSSR